MMSSVDTGPAGAWRRGGGGGGRRGWKPLEILAVVLGFMVYWPIGLALLSWKLVQRRGEFDPAYLAQWRQKMEGLASWRGQACGSAWSAFGHGPSGNAAFDAWRKQEIERLEAERQKLETAQREFSDFVAEARKARDREEFERFMRDRPVSQD